MWRPSELPDYDGPLLLDTHIWIWHIDGDESQTAVGTRELLDRSGSASRLLVSDISYWEVAVKAAKGRLTWSIDTAVWLQRAGQAPGIAALPLDRPTLLLSNRLGGSAHNDPADRMLMAASRLNNLPLVTADQLIVEYAAANPGTSVVGAARFALSRAEWTKIVSEQWARAGAGSPSMTILRFLTSACG